MADMLNSLSNDLASTVAAAADSLVRIEARRRQPATGIVWSAEGLIVTAHHVIERDDNIRVGLPNGETATATLVGRDPTTDIAILRANVSGMTAPNWTTGSDLRVGHLVLAIGRPERDVQATLGIISALGEAWRTGAGGHIEQYVQTDVIMYPGFSGGALVSADGGFVGLNSSALTRDSSVTIPAATLIRVAEMLLTHGKVKRGFLGVSAQPVKLPANAAQMTGQETGLLLVSVEPGSPAEMGGLMMGDTLLSLEGQPLNHMDDLMGMLTSDRVGKNVMMKVLRGGQSHDMAVTIGEKS